MYQNPVEFRRKLAKIALHESYDPPAEEGKDSALGELVKINVGGTIFETHLSTLTRISDTVLSTMVASRREQQQVLFVDRNPTHFAEILDYLRDSGSFTPPSADDAREELRKEAKFYNLSGLVEMCSPEVFRLGDRVQWKERAVESYGKFLLSYWLSRSFPTQCPDCASEDANYTITRFFCDKRGRSYWNPAIESYTTLLHMKHHMLLARGTIQSISGTFCLVRWDEKWEDFLPQTVLRLAKE